ncbi:hypothetical protein SAMN02745975_03537 [Geosporobacter subterraneus DSM 17957]|uniref:Uncharacterized protein n=1 Tax=Geosporobacter subterraneus DSM 17957 TaxID=1121919 RepID=A0A1M6PBG6_9FIRM|nr:hypothetical protein [Geosporobacter subterraneus]SHK05283.1 hypothetical protein SAMN02745975_03537 [Geosporobacter subterraneus DSM 17957]
MNILISLFVSIVLLIDFLKLKKNDKKVVYIYIGITILVLVISLLNRYEFFSISPIEIWIEKMKPITDWATLSLE